MPCPRRLQPHLPQRYLVRRVIQYSLQQIPTHPQIPKSQNPLYLPSTVRSDVSFVCVKSATPDSIVPDTALPPSAPVPVPLSEDAVEVCVLSVTPYKSTLYSNTINPQILTSLGDS